jgi:hypothetical protein
MPGTPPPCTFGMPGTPPAWMLGAPGTPPAPPLGFFRGFKAARRHLEEALATFRAIPARLEAERTRAALDDLTPRAG